MDLTLRKHGSSTLSDTDGQLDEPRKPSGLFKPYHGIHYQVQWTMALALQVEEHIQTDNNSENRGFNFKPLDRFEIEDPEAGKFDDLVWRYEKTGEPDRFIYNFLQAKHKLNPLEKITIQDLLKPRQEKCSKDNRPFSLAKYFISYKNEIRKNPKYLKNGSVGELIIATNIDFNGDLKKMFKHCKVSFVEPLQSEAGSQHLCWKMRKGDSENKTLIIELLENTYDSIQIIQKLLHSVIEDEAITKESLIGPYFGDLLENKIISETGKFHANFIKNCSQLSAKAVKFRNSLFELGFQREHMNLKRDFFLSNPKELAAKIVSLLSTNTDNIHNKVIRITRNSLILRKNIDKFANYVFVEDEKDNSIKFSNSFLKDPQLPNRSLKEFRDALKEKLQDDDEFTALRNYSFIITGKPTFTTCREMIIREELFWNFLQKYDKFKVDVDRTELLRNFRNSEFLLREGIVNESGKFTEKFKTGDDLSEEAKKFRKYLDEIQENGKENIRLEQFDTDTYETPKKKSKTYEEKTISVENFWKQLEVGNVQQNIKNFITLKDKILPEENLKDIRDEIKKDFIGRLVFVVNCSQEILDKFIKKKCSWFLGIDTDYIAYEFQTKISAILNLNGNKFISTAGDVHTFFYQARRKVDQLILIGPTLTFEYKLNKLDIEFEMEDIQEYLVNSFFISDEFKVLNIFAKNKTLTALKVYQAMRNRRTGSYVFVKSNSALSMKDRLLQAFEKISLMVVVCDHKTDDLVNFYNESIKLYEKLIFITSFNISEQKTIVPIKKMTDSKNNFFDLTIESQNKLSEKICVELQGQSMRLDASNKSLISCLDSDLLLKFIKDDKLIIGDDPVSERYYKIKDYFEERQFLQHVCVRRDFEKCRSKFNIVKEGNESVNRRLKRDKDVVVITSSKDFFVKTVETCENPNVHWFKNETDCCTWMNSYGNIVNLLDLVKTDHHPTRLHKFNDISDKIAIISAEPGMGKSRILDHLALKIKKSKPVLWILKINLVDHCSELNKIQSVQKDLIPFLYCVSGFQIFKDKSKKARDTIEQLLKIVKYEDNKICLENDSLDIDNKDLFEIKLFNDFYNNRRMAFLLDGFDEINPTYKDIVISLLGVLKRNADRLVLTTRPYNILHELEKELNTFSYSLLPYDEKQQRNYLKQFWKNHFNFEELDEQLLNKFIDNLLETFKRSTNDHDMIFLGVPLHTFMFADFSIGKSKTFQDFNHSSLSEKARTFSEEFNLLTLYNYFFETKFSKSFEKENPRFSEDKYKPATQERYQREKKEMIKHHRQLAFFEIFSKKEIKTLLSPKEIWDAQNSSRIIEEKMGIVMRDADGKPRSIHRTFAEYFIAGYIWQKFVSTNIQKFDEFLTKFIIKPLIKQDRVDICLFLHLEAQKASQKDPNIIDKLKICKLYNVCLHNYDLKRSSDRAIDVLMNVVEYFLDNNVELKIPKRYINKDGWLKLIYACAHMGYPKLIESTLKNVPNTSKQLLTRNYDAHNPHQNAVGIAALENRIAVLKVFLASSLLMPQFKSIIWKIIFDVIFETQKWEVIKECSSLLSVEEVTTYHPLLLYEVLKGNATTDVVEIFLEKTESEAFVSFIDKIEGNNKLDSHRLISQCLLKYNRAIVDLAIGKKILGPGNVYILLPTFIKESVCGWTKSLLNDCNLTFFTDHQYENFIYLIEGLVKCGADYNLIISPSIPSTLDYSRQFYHVQQFFKELHNLYKGGMYKNINPLDIILISLYMEVYLLDEDSFFNLRKEKLFKLYAPKAESEILRECHEDNSYSVDSTLNELKSYIDKSKRVLKQFLQSKSRNLEEEVLTCYEKFIHEYEPENANLKGKARDLFGRILLLTTKQGYKIDDAFSEVSEEVIKHCKLIKALKTSASESDQLEILGRTRIDVNVELLDLVGLIHQNFGTDLLFRTCDILCEVGRRKIVKVLGLMSQRSEQSAAILKLYGKLDNSYNKVITTNEREQMKVRFCIEHLRRRIIRNTS